MLRVAFMGAPDFAVPTLVEIVGAGHDVCVVYTQPPRPAGRRGLEPTKTPVHKQAEVLGIPVETPLSLKSETAIETFRTFEVEVAVVVAYGLLLPQPILDIPQRGCMNFHPSNLPRWRGAAPMQRTIMAGDTDTAACVMRMETGLDTGPVCLKEQIAVPSEMTAGELHDLMAQRGGDLAKAGELAYGEIPELEKQLTDMDEAESEGSSDMMVEETVLPDHIAQVVSRWTGVPVDKMLEGERDKLLRMEDELAKQVVGQGKAVQAVSKAVPEKV